VDNHLYRICSGMIALTYKKKKYFYSFPSNKTLYKAEILENDILESNPNIMTHEESIELLTRLGRWSESKEKEISEEIPKIMDNIKIEIYMSYERDRGEIPKLKLKLIKIKNYLFKLLSEKHQFDKYNIESIAKKEKTLFLIKQCVDKLDVKPEKLLDPYYSSFLDESIIRKIARSNEWHVKWVGMKNGCKVFSGHLTEEQERLIKWSLIYDNIAESGESPPQEILDDDDALDGYFLYRKIEKTDGAVLKQIEDNYARRGIKYNELYLPAKDMEEARRNDFLNSDEARRIKKARFEQINKEGVVKDADLRDNRLRLDIAKNNLEMK
jgi:hypothetical protein